METGNLKYNGQDITLNGQVITYGGGGGGGGEDDPRYVAWATATELGKERVRRLIALGYLG